MLLGIPPGFDLELEVVEPRETSRESPVILRLDSYEYDSLYRDFQKDIKYLTSKFQHDISLQNSEVETLIAAENEKIRIKQEEERKRREEEQRIAKEKAEAERKRLEEERKKAEEEKKKDEEAKRVLLEAERVKKEEKAKLKAAEEAKQQQENEKLEQQKRKQEAEANSKKLTEKRFFEFKDTIASINANIKSRVEQDKALKKAVGPVRRAINPRFGQLSSSESQLRSITQSIVASINEVKGHELAFPFILNFIAKALVSQAETEIVVQPNSALPLAKLTKNLLDLFPELNDYLMPRFIKKCPLIIGYTCSIDTEEGRLRMGWKRNKSTKKWEEEDKYDERVAGICSLFATLSRLDCKQYPISMSWEFLARIGNLQKDLITNVHYFCIANWWECCAKFFVQTYKTQAVKLLDLLSHEFTQDVKFPASYRLRLLGDEGIDSNIKTIREMSP